MKNAARIILISALLAAGVVQAQNYPGTRPVRILVGYTPGGGVDTAARMMAQALGELWGGNVLVENRPGAAGLVGAELIRPLGEARGGDTPVAGSRDVTATWLSLSRSLS